VRFHACEALFRTTSALSGQQATGNVYDALVPQRIDKCALSHAGAAAISAGKRGRQFDPALVTALSKSLGHSGKFIGALPMSRRSGRGSAAKNR